jgi:Protein of unknown function (DUF1571)
MSSYRRPRPGNGKYTALSRYVRIGLWIMALAVVGYPPLQALPKVAADPPPIPPTAQIPPAGGPARPSAVAVPAVASPLDQPLQCVAEARQTYQRIRDYTCTLIKQERVGGQLQPENIIAVKFRNQPFSVYMKWSAPRDSLGQEVCYVQGRNNNMMRVHPSGILGGMAGFVNIDPRDPKVMQNSRHTIHEAGLGNMIERLARSWEEDRRQGITQARVAEYEYNKRRCIRVETYHTRQMPQAYCWRTVVFFDKETKLPIRTETYDFPHPGGPPAGDLLETFSYIDVRYNVGLTDAAFNY